MGSIKFVKITVLTVDENCAIIYSIINLQFTFGDRICIKKSSYDALSCHYDVT